MLSILVLSSIMAISFSLATILLVELRNSGDLLRTESSYYGSQAVTEEALFKLKRQATVTYSGSIGEVALNNPAPIETKLTEPIFQDKVAPLTSTSNTTSRYPLFDTANLTGGSGYGYVTITRLPSGNNDPLYVYFCQFDPNAPIDTYTPVSEPCTYFSSSSTGYWNLTNGFNYNLSSTEGSKSWFINSSMQQQIILVNPGSTGNINFSIQAYDTGGNPKGIPYSGKTAVEIVGGLGGVSRKIRVVIPDAASGSGISGTDTVWVEDSVPSGVTQDSDGGDAWTWISSSPSPYSGSLAHRSNISSGEHQHYFYNASGASTLSINSTEKLFAYVYLDPANPPSQVMLQWNSSASGWAHRAYWGSNSICWSGCTESTSNHYMGTLPSTGQWVRLEVPAAEVGLTSHTLVGMAFTLYGGRATWDKAGKNSP